MPSLPTTEFGSDLMTCSVEYLRDYGSNRCRDSRNDIGTELYSSHQLPRMVRPRNYTVIEEQFYVWSSDSVVVRLIFEQARLKLRGSSYPCIFDWKLSEVMTPRRFGKDAFGYYNLTSAWGRKYPITDPVIELAIDLNSHVAQYLRKIDADEPPGFYILMNFGVSVKYSDAQGRTTL